MTLSLSTCRTIYGQVYYDAAEMEDMNCMYGAVEEGWEGAQVADFNPSKNAVLQAYRTGLGMPDL